MKKPEEIRKVAARLGIEKPVLISIAREISHNARIQEIEQLTALEYELLLDRLQEIEASILWELANSRPLVAVRP